MDYLRRSSANGVSMLRLSIKNTPPNDVCVSRGGYIPGGRVMRDDVCYCRDGWCYRCRGIDRSPAVSDILSAAGPAAGGHVRIARPS